jgi:alanyl-tRNA synthetase
MKTSDEIRETFLRYFEERGHKRVNSGPLVPKDDPTLLFTNAGMNQFKDVFLGHDRRDYSRATSSQKCMRVSGKHNDLESVGRTPRHHTFFEMLGNFSFGDYFKTEAIEFAWELCTEVYGLEKDRLIVTVFEEDDEALEIWRDHVGVPSEIIYKCDEKENFWSMGETGPCGPCSELHYDLGDRIGDIESPFGAESDRFVEIWNLVFMQFNRDANGKMTPLPSPSIDTGMGLERIACVLQGLSSNYDTDLFQPLIEEASRLTGIVYGESPDNDTSLRILADHSRACMFLIDDGVVPGNEGRGYVLRKILRRAIRHGKMLGQEHPFIFTLTSLVAEIMSEGYPELVKTREYAAKVVKNEEERFSATLSHGMTLLERIFESVRGSGSEVIPGSELFRLYDTYGFPLDLAREIAEESKLCIDETGFREELEKQRRRARASWKGGETIILPIYRELASEGISTEFTGHEATSGIESKVLAILRDEQPAEFLGTGEEGEIVLDRTPFYAEAGGQIADQGIVENEICQAEVQDVQIPVPGLRLHKVRVLHGQLATGDELRASIDVRQRHRTASNHTATHLLHAALREIVGEHVKQAGSMVAPDRLRFDFTHYQPLSAWEIQRIEEIVNEKIRTNIEVNTEIRDLDEAVESGAMALFGERYDQKVRVVSIPGYSMELCGGTHVGRTGDISLFKIVSEGSISAGVRRIEAVTGADAVERFLSHERLLAELSEQLHVRSDQLIQAVEKLAGDARESRKELERLQIELARDRSDNALRAVQEVQGVKVLSLKVENLDRSALRQLADQLKNKLGSGVVVLGVTIDDRVSIVSMVSDDLTGRLQANELIRPIAQAVGGGGGGKADMAEAGGRNPAALDQALKEVYPLVAEALATEPSPAEN